MVFLMWLIHVHLETLAGFSQRLPIMILMDVKMLAKITMMTMTESAMLKQLLVSGLVAFLLLPPTCVLPALPRSFQPQPMTETKTVVKTSEKTSMMIMMASRTR